MANPKLEHNQLQDRFLHDNYGVASADDHTALTADTGASVWKEVDSTNLTTSLEPLGNSLFYIQHRLSNGTSGGGNGYISQPTGSITRWDPGVATDRSFLCPFNTVKVNEISGASLDTSSTNIGAFTLPAGKYYYKSETIQLGWNGRYNPNDQINNNGNKLVLRRISDEATILRGIGNKGAGDTRFDGCATYPGKISGFFELTGPTVLGVWSPTSDQITGNGTGNNSAACVDGYIYNIFGRPASAGEDEVYAQAAIWKLN
jgi:hypothetical protein